jgi:hypothetical protein
MKREPIQMILSALDRVFDDVSQMIAQFVSHVSSPLLTRHAARNARPVAMRHSVTLDDATVVFFDFFDQETKGQNLAGPRRHFLTPSLFLTAPRPHLFASAHGVGPPMSASGKTDIQPTSLNDRV